MFQPTLQNQAKRELNESQKKNPSQKLYDMDLKRKPYLFVPVYYNLQLIHHTEDPWIFKDNGKYPQALLLFPFTALECSGLQTTSHLNAFLGE